MANELIHETALETSALLGQAETDPQLRENIDRAFDNRWGSAEDVRLLSRYAIHAPQLPDSTARQVFEEVASYERSLVAPGISPGETLDGSYYGIGSAEHDDQLVIVGRGPILMEAQHATDPVRKATGRREAADHGTAGLAASIAYAGLGRAIIPIGRQTGNANVNETHPIKDALLAEIADPSTDYRGFISVHGKIPGRATDLRDREEVHAVIGLGRNPDDEAFEMAARLTARAHDDLGLRLVVGNTMPQLVYKTDPEYNGSSFRDKINELEMNPITGLPKVSKLAAANALNTASFMQGVLDSPMIAQLEISRSLRYTPHERDHGALVMGVYLGHSLLKIAAEVMLGRDSIDA